MSDLEITKKFTMLSTKEWLNYFQQKLAPERERELDEQAQIDPFLNEALKSLSNPDVRPIAYQSFNTLIHQINSATGIAESNVLNNNQNSNRQESSINFKKIALALGILLILGLIGYGIYYLIENQSLTSDNEEDNTEIIEAESTEMEAESKPFDQLPESDNVTMDTSTKITTKPKTTRTETTDDYTNQLNESNPRSFSNVNPPNGVSTTSTQSTSKSSSGQSTSNKVETNRDQFKTEKDKFDKAQDLYRQGKMEESKKILYELKSYDNPMKSKSEEILNNIDN